MLSFSQQAEACADQYKAKAMGPKTTLYPNSNQQARSKGSCYISDQLIPSENKNTPHMILFGGMFNYQTLLYKQQALEKQ